MSKDFYRTSTHIWPHTSVPWQQNIVLDFLKSIPISMEWNVIDIGAGTGNNLQSLTSQINKVTVLDVSEFALDALSKKYRNQFKFLKILHKNVLNTNLPDKHFDLIFLTEVIEHVENHDLVFSEINRILKPGGYVIVSAPNYCNLAGLWKFIFEKFFHRTWDAWGTHNHGTEHFITSFKLISLCKKQKLHIIKGRGGDILRSWCPFLKRYYLFIDRHPFLKLGKILPIKYFLMNYFILAKKSNSLQ